MSASSSGSGGSSGSMLRLRDATVADMPQVLEIYNHIILNTTAVYSYTAHTLEMREQWLKQRTEDGFPVFMVEEEVDEASASSSSSGSSGTTSKTILGFGSYGAFRAWAGFKYSVENSVYVAEHARGKGAGKLLLQAIIDHAKSSNKVHAIVAGIDATNVASIALHRRFGFVETGTMKQVGFKFGRWLDLAFLQLTFEDAPLAPNEDDI
jgi:phosphinothricin acetyltransferase